MIRSASGGGYLAGSKLGMRSGIPVSRHFSAITHRDVFFYGKDQGMDVTARLAWFLLEPEGGIRWKGVGMSGKAISPI